MNIGKLFQVDGKCSSVLVGFDDGVVRHISICKYEQRAGRQKANQSDVGFHLTQVFKPHLKAVNCLKIDGEGKVLATGVRIFLNLGCIYKVNRHVLSLPCNILKKWLNMP